jgi:hypothetical protein
MFDAIQQRFREVEKLDVMLFSSYEAEVMVKKITSHLVEQGAYFFPEMIVKQIRETFDKRELSSDCFFDWYGDTLTNQVNLATISYHEHLAGFLEKAGEVCQLTYVDQRVLDEQKMLLGEFGKSADAIRDLIEQERRLCKKRRDRAVMHDVLKAAGRDLEEFKKKGGTEEAWMKKGPNPFVTCEKRGVDILRYVSLGDLRAM